MGAQKEAIGGFSLDTGQFLCPLGEEGSVLVILFAEP